MAKVIEIVAAAERLWPQSAAEEWDRPGLVSGSAHQEVSKVLISVDVTAELIDDAIAGGFEMIISHHPFLLRGVTSVAEDTGKGAVLAKAFRHEIALFAAHTNADITGTGVSATLADALGLSNLKPLVATENENGHGRVGTLSKSMTLLEFARQVAKSIPATAAGIKVSGSADQQIRTVALCGGAGDSFIEAALQSSADVYVTSDLRHHPTQDAMESARAAGRQFALIDISHWAAESLWLSVAAKELEIAVPGVKFEVSDLRTDPWGFAVTQ